MNDMIDQLTQDLKPSSPRSGGLTVLGSMALASLIPLAIVLFVFGPRADIGSAVALPHFWVKMGVMALIASCAAPALVNLSRPGEKPGPGLVLAGLAGGVLLLAGLVNLAMAPEPARMEVLLGHSVSNCLWKVGVLSIPLFAASIFGLRHMAPTQPRLAGLAAGLVAGGGAAAIYSLSCGETSLTFLSSWYLLAVVLVAFVGFLLGPRLLRW